MNENKEVLQETGQGPSFWVLGDLYTFKATGKQTNGSYTVMEQIIQPQNGPPPHIHRREDEAFYVLEGTFSFLSGDRETVLQTGGFAHIPRGTLHTFRNIGEKPGKLLVVVTPAGLEEFFYAVGTPAAGSSAPPPFDPGVVDRLMKLAGEYEMEIVLPGEK